MVIIDIVSNNLPAFKIENRLLPLTSSYRCVSHMGVQYLGTRVFTVRLHTIPMEDSSLVRHGTTTDDGSPSKSPKPVG